jgi:hypothetical protein
MLTSTRPPKAPPCVKPRRLSHHACLCDAPFDRYAIARKKSLNKIFKEVSKEKVTKSLYFTYARGHSYPTDCNGSWHVGLGHQRNQTCKFLQLYVKGFGFCELSVEYRLFPQEADIALTTFPCATALACDYPLPSPLSI